jgi:hypothetical protein
LSHLLFETNCGYIIIFLIVSICLRNPGEKKSEMLQRHGMRMRAGMSVCCRAGEAVSVGEKKPVRHGTKKKGKMVMAGFALPSHQIPP